MPETMSPGYSAAEHAAYVGVRRVCDAGLDSMTLRTEVARRIAALIPSDASYFGSSRRLAGRVAPLVAGAASDDAERQFFQVVYPLADAPGTNDLAQSGAVATTAASGERHELMHDGGLGRELRAVFALAGEPGGFWFGLRERRSRGFGEHDVVFLRRIAPHVARALRRAALVDAAELVGPADLEQGVAERGRKAPGVFVVDDRWRVTHSTPAADAYLADLADESAATSAPTSALLDFVRRQRASGGVWGVAMLSVQGRSGRWYSVRAALSEPDEFGRSSTVVIITPARATSSSSRAAWGRSRGQSEWPE